MMTWTSAIEIDGMKVKITKHALDRMLDMRLDGDDIRRAIESPDSTAPSKKYKGCTNWRYADFTLGTKWDGDVLVILTVVWATDEAWQQDLLTLPPGDRVYRKHFSQQRRR